MKADSKTAADSRGRRFRALHAGIRVYAPHTPGDEVALQELAETPGEELRAPPSCCLPRRGDPDLHSPGHKRVGHLVGLSAALDAVTSSPALHDGLERQGVCLSFIATSIP
jgi:hypothetical protein